MARATMASLISELRLLTDAGASDYTVNSVAYWTDDQLQAILDQYRRDIRYQAMDAQPTYAAGGAVSYTDYWTGLSSWEGSPTVQDSNYNTQGTATYSFDATKGVVTFGSDTAGATRIITGAIYDLNAAAAEVWNRKAAHYATVYDVSTDNHNLRRSQIVQQCREQARAFGIMQPSWQRGQGGGGRQAYVYADRGDM